MGGEGPEGCLSWGDHEGIRGGVSVMGSARRGPQLELGGPGCEGSLRGSRGPCRGV